jgi:acyl-CoA thioesterase-2
MSESTLERLIAIFDVAPAGPSTGRAPTSFIGDSDGGGRNVVDGSQILAQSLVAAGKALSGRSVRSVRSVHALFVAAAHPAKPLEFIVTPVRAGRSFASAAVTVNHGDRTCVTATVLLDHPQPDVIRHDQWTGPAPDGPDAAYPALVHLAGRQLRIEGIRDHNSPDEAGPPVLDAWLHYDTVPGRDDLRRALPAHFTGHLSISTTFRAHPGIGTAQARHTVSTAMLGIGVTFHDPVEWDGWLRYHHESTYVGAGMSYVRGQVATAGGRLIASFTQDAMIRALEPTSASAALPAESRL